MSTFLKLNSNKLKFASIFSAVACLVFVALVLLIAYAKGHPPNKNLFAAILFVSIIGMPIIVIGVSFLVWYYNHNKRKMLFKKEPFNKLEELGFYKYLKNEKTKWHFTEEIKGADINGFTIVCDLGSQNSNMIEFAVLHVFRKIDKPEYERLEKVFNDYNCYFKLDSIAKSYSSKQTKLLTIQELKRDLQQFTSMLKQEGFIINPSVGSV